MADSTSATVNPDLAALHSQLVKLVAALDAAVASAATKSQVTALLDEIAEVNARVTMTGRQLFTQQTAAITREAAKVSAAVPEVQKAIDQLDNLKEFVGAMTKFLKMVDKVLSVAKLVV